MKVEIDYGGGARVAIERGASVLEASLRAGVPHAHACGGAGRCTTCRVRIEQGLEHCPPPGPLEAEALAVNGLAPPVRLACQLRPSGDVKLRVLIPAHPQPSPPMPSGSVEELVSALFTDLRGFTSFAESHLPFDVSAVVNRYFDTMGVLVERHSGHILDYLGDGIMTLFRPGEGDDEPSRRAVRCALEMRQGFRSLGSYVEEHFGAELRLGAAIAYGRAVVGRLGYFRDRHLGALGDALNLAARLEDLNKELQSDILITETVAEQVRDLVAMGRRHELMLRGRRSAITAFEVVGASPPL